MSRQLPVPVRSGPKPRVERPEVIVVDGRGQSRRLPDANPLLRLVLHLAPDLIRAVERPRTPRRDVPVVPLAPRSESRVRGVSVQLSEVEYDLRLPFVRRVTVRKAAAWSVDLPTTPAEGPRRGNRLRRAGIVSASALAIAALGMLANRSGSLSGIDGRRGRW